MIRARFFGSDPDFCAWLRRQKKELPSYSKNVGFVASDVDLIVHRYITDVDGLGTREIQATMMLEVKTRNGKPTYSQLQTLNLWHQTIYPKKTVDEKIIRNFGVSILILSGTDPDNSEIMQWGRFNSSTSSIYYRQINKSQLFKLLRFELHPENLTLHPFRRHHKTSEIRVIEQEPLGFHVEKTIKQVS